MRVLKVCGTCARWHKAKGYHCQYSGYWGGNLIYVDYCKWISKNKNKNKNKKRKIVKPKTKKKG